MWTVEASIIGRPQTPPQGATAHGVWRWCVHTGTPLPQAAVPQPVLLLRAVENWGQSHESQNLWFLAPPVCPAKPGPGKGTR